MRQAEQENPPVKKPPSLWEVLGAALRRLSPMYWEERMLFGGASDRELLKQTFFFPERQRHPFGTHPIFVLRITHPMAVEVCPCSTKGRMAARFIRQGCTLEITGKVMDRRSYLIEAFRFPLPSDPAFWKPLSFWGKVPETCLEPVQGP
ncbi:MAG: hypothetical protein WHS46_02810 [Desulfosoma sp.]